MKYGLVEEKRLQQTLFKISFPSNKIYFWNNVTRADLLKQLWGILLISHKIGNIFISGRKNILFIIMGVTVAAPCLYCTQICTKFMQIEIPEQHLVGRNNCPNDECAGDLFFFFVFLYFCPVVFCFGFGNQNRQSPGQTTWRGEKKTVAAARCQFWEICPACADNGPAQRDHFTWPRKWFRPWP